MISKLKNPAWVFGLLFLLLSAGCRPEGVIPRDEMVSLFCDFYLADAVIDVEQSTGEPVRGLDSLRIYEPIVRQHGYTKDAFRSSLEYYMHHPDDMEAIYKRVQAQLARNSERVVEQEEVDEEENPRFVPADEDEEPGDRPFENRREMRQRMRKSAGPVADKEQQIEQQPEQKTEQKLEQNTEQKVKKPLRRKMTKDKLKQLEEELK